MKHKIVAFVPIKLNNERFPGKNLKKFGDGKVLLTYFLEKIIQVKHIDEFYVFCSDESIKPFLNAKVSFLKRPQTLDSQETTSQDIIRDFMDKVEADIYCLCHCTSPFVSVEHFNQAVESLVLGEFDSAFTARKIQKHLWKSDKNALNFDPQNIPRTQDLPILYEEIPAIFAFRRDTFKMLQRRVGINPCIVEVDEVESVDIDYPQEFYIADAIYMNKKDS
ncbi:acylneuraminate cytidylyltransferase family protein [Helicobacter sp. MIT 05-5294]|uniref:acylneuraminate cytidylyltransferase family protein n=1 Tax=Helicobacter sp. MIT 05-5294 TaxID=1548150 RepID=UPI00051F9370|nr:acylneuraminate cytidylyltransferase family protein [Helicobacter sp. MIT 05-5294]TLD89230.1 acylneuraminate cytidylyltransferase family protein [Helicobacter sp. MIT 05-5294]